MAIVLVTGSNSGFGRAIALGFLGRGDTVVATMRRVDRGDELRSAARGLRGVLDVAPLDSTDDDSRRRAVADVVERHGRVDVLVNNAGISHVAALEDTPAEVTAQVFATNVLGPLELARAVLPHMRARGSGRIVSVTAIGAVLCTPYLGAYVGSKHAADAITAALDLEVRPFGIRAVSVLPGAFHTNIASADASAYDTSPYAEATGRFRAGLQQRIASAPTDLGPVVEAVIRAATVDDPPQRTVVASPEMSVMLEPVVGALDELHTAEGRRLGLVPQ